MTDTINCRSLDLHHIIPPAIHPKLAYIRIVFPAKRRIDKPTYFLVERPFNHTTFWDGVDEVAKKIGIDLTTICIHELVYRKIAVGWSLTMRLHGRYIEKIGPHPLCQ